LVGLKIYRADQMSYLWNRYVPVLRLKPAELWALRYLAGNVHDSVIPILELIPRNFPSAEAASVKEMEAYTKEIACKIWNAWGTRPFFLDTMHIRDLNIVHRVFDLLGQLDSSDAVCAIPMVTLQTSAVDLIAIRRMAAKLNSGISIRLRRENFDVSDVGASIGTLLATLEVDPLNIDFVVDLGFSAGDVPFRRLRGRIPQIDEWRSLTVLAGSFPKNLEGMRPGVHRLRRIEWQHWVNELSILNADERIPQFGDYTVQYAYYVEPPSHPNPSASIRYASDTEWVIMRGEGIRNEGSPGTKQWAANAQLLCGMPEFRGAQFSRGDKEIAERAGRYSDPGGAMTWIRAAINHHIVLTTRQILDFYGTIAVGFPISPNS